MSGILTPNLIRPRCNIFGGEGGPRDTLNLGGLGPTPTVNWYCKNLAVGRFRMTCPHEHRGQPMLLCMDHFMRYRDCVDFCPPCNIPPSDHKCRLELTHVS